MKTFPKAVFPDYWKELGADVLLFGHTHKPYHRPLAYEQEGQTCYQYALNIGSVGKPNMLRKAC